MNAMGISTDPALLDVELPTLNESPTVSTFLQEEEASICPLLSNTNGTSTPVTFSHPLTPCVDNDSQNSANMCNEDAKVETSSSTGSSSGIGMDAPESTLFNNLAYQHLQINNGGNQDSNGHGPNGNLTLSKDTPSFVSWNWPLIRKCTFFVFMSSLLAMFAIVVAMIATLPKTCNPKTAWYRGSVFYEIFPASFQDSTNDGVGDIRGIASRIDYLSSLQVSAVRLNSIFPSAHYPDDYQNITSLVQIAEILGDLNDLRQLAQTLHDHNISLILDLPIAGHVKAFRKVFEPEINVLASTQNISATTTTTTMKPNEDDDNNLVIEALHKWLQLGVDGFYIKGLENFAYEEHLLSNIAEWKRLVGVNRVLIVSESLIVKLDANKRSDILTHIDLVDVHLDMLSGTHQLAERIKSVLSEDLAPIKQKAWIHWTIAGVEKQRLKTRDFERGKVTLAATIMQLMLPGTPSIFYGDEIALESIADPHNEHSETKHLHHLATMHWSNTTNQFTNHDTLPWLPQSISFNFEHYKVISKMIKLRDRSPSIYKNAICKPETILRNTQIHRSHDDILVVERIFPRRNTFVSISNFGSKHVNMDMTSMYYSGLVMLGDGATEKIYFANFEIGPLETIVVKLDK